MMHEREKSDPAVVAVKLANKAERSAAESVEPRAGTEGNAGQHSTCRAQYRVSVSPALERIRHVRRQTPEVGAVCGKAARTVLCGGRSAMSVPTAIASLAMTALLLNRRGCLKTESEICSDRFNGCYFAAIMIAVPIAAEPKVITKPNSNSPSAVPGDESARIRSRKPAGLSASRPATSSAASTIPAARLIASSRNSGTRQKPDRWGNRSRPRTSSGIAACLHLLLRITYQSCDRSAGTGAQSAHPPAVEPGPRRWSEIVAVGDTCKACLLRPRRAGPLERRSKPCYANHSINGTPP